MNVVMVSTTPLAGAPYENMKCLVKYAGLNIRWVAVTNMYGDGRTFPSDLLWNKDRDECIRVINNADVIHIQNGVHPTMEPYLGNKPYLCQWHSVPQQAAFYKYKSVCKHQYTIMQPLQLNAYGLPALPNMMDPEEYKAPGDKENTYPVVVYAPTNDWPKQMIGSKGKADVEKILRSMSGFNRVVFSNDNYEYNLKRKSYGDILIDDVVAPTFHKTTLEGCCFGLAVITGALNQKWCTADLGSLSEELNKLVSDREYLLAKQASCRNFIEVDYHPRNLVAIYVEAYKKCIAGRV